MTTQQQPAKTHKKHKHHFHIPFQLLLGLLFFSTGLLLLLKTFNVYSLPIPEEVYFYVTAFGSTIGGLYLIITKIYKPRIYL